MELNLLFLFYNLFEITIISKFKMKYYKHF